jgi:hypothetical protein
MILMITLFMAAMLTAPGTAATPPTAASLVQPAERTPITPEGLLDVLEKGHIEVFDAPPSKGRLRMAWAQIAFENGQGKAVFNHNLGNVGPGKRNFRVHLNDGGYYRAFSSFDEAARTYWTHLRDHCPGALAAFSSLNAQEVSDRLRHCGYHRTEVNQYARGLSGLLRTSLHLLH